MTNPFIAKDYNQIFESLRIQLTGGEKEQFLYFPDYSYPVQGTTIAIHGIREGRPYSFKKEEDYVVNIVNEQKKLSWKPNRNPDEGTYFVVYYHKNAPEITDMNVGSVARTICEAFAFELSFLHQSIQKFHEAMYLETAQGMHLDRLAKLFQIERIGSGKIYFTTEVIFHRQGIGGEITIKAGTLLQTEKNEIFVTMNDVKIPPNARTSNVVLARSQQGFEDEAKAKAKEIGLELKRIPMPINGIEKVEQKGSISIKESIIESDDSLRERCKQVLSSMGKCTVQAIEYELMSKGAQEVIVYTHDKTPQGETIHAGHIKVVAYLPHGQNKEDKKKELDQHLCNIKAAGIISELIWAEEIPYTINVTPILIPRYSYCDIKQLEEKEKQIHFKINQEIESYFKRLKVGRKPRIEKLKATLINCDPAILDCKIEGIAETPIDYNTKAILNAKNIQGYTKIIIPIQSIQNDQKGDRKIQSQSTILNDFRQQKESLLEKWFETKWATEKNKTWKQLFASFKEYFKYTIKSIAIKDKRIIYTEEQVTSDKFQEPFTEPFHITLQDKQ